jgi:ankyrin repeat domain-containing protein 50
MAEFLAVVGIVSNFASVIQISGQILTACYAYYRGVHDAKGDIERIIGIVETLKSVLERLHDLVKDKPGDETEPALDSLREPLKQCDEALQELGRGLGIPTQEMTNTNPINPSFRTKMRWPFKSKDVDKILKKIENHRATFILAVSENTLRTVRAVNSTVTEISESIQTISINQTGMAQSMQSMQNTTIIRWLNAGVGDPSSSYELAKQKREPMTGRWFIESDDFKSWIQRTRTSAWLHGIPGAGKTILCSTIIEYVEELCLTESTHQYAYFYFDFNDTAKQRASQMLRSVIAQLCSRRRDVPAELHELYRQNDNGQREPTYQQLIETLHVLAKSFPTYIIMDALDESSERKELLKTITKELCGKMNILVTSRKEQDINEFLDGVAGITVSLAGSGIDNDIEFHVRKCLQTDKPFQNWPSSLNQKIEETLVKKANGM